MAGFPSDIFHDAEAPSPNATAAPGISATSAVPPASSHATPRTAMRDTPLTRTWCVAALALVSCALWGSAIPCIKIGYALWGIDGVNVPSELLFAGVRFMLAGLIALGAFTVTQRRIPRVSRAGWPLVVKLSLAQTIVQYAFFYIGVSNASGVRGSIVNATSTFLCVLVAALVFRQERLSARKIVGCAIGFAGVIIVNLTGGDRGGAVSLTGEGFILIAACSYAVSSALIHTYAQREDPVALSGYQFVLGGAVLSVIGLACGGRLGSPSAEAVGMTLYLACVSGVAYSLWSILLKHNPTSRVTIFGFMNPVFGVVLSSALLGEGATLPWVQTVLALVLVVAGIIIVNRSPHDQTV